MLKHLKRVFIQFHPSDTRATAARELLARVGNDKARKSNPDCVVDYKVVETAQIPRSFIELQFADNEQHKLYTADLKVCAAAATAAATALLAFACCVAAVQTPVLCHY
jgi:large subunit ribosomal protein L53